MLAQLARYAREHDLSVEPGFAPKAVRWALVMSPEGAFLEVLELGDPDQKRNPGRLFLCCPELSQPEIKRGGAGCRHFLVDNAEVVALLDADPDDAKVRAKHAYFVDLLRQASEAMPELKAISEGLDDPETLERIREGLAQSKARKTDNVTFSVPGRRPTFLVEGEEWHNWWRSFRSGLAPPEKTERSGKQRPRLMRCLVSGELVEPAPTQPKIKGLADVGGLPMGDVLAAFKQEAFCSYGLTQAANAAVSPEMAMAYREALNHLLRHHSTRLAGTRVVHWFRSTVPPEDDPLDWLEADAATEEASAQQRARELLNAIRDGRRPDLAGNTYYALTLSGASGRVMVRDYLEGPFEDLVANVEAWFDDLEIVRRDGSALALPPKFLAVLGALVRDLDDLPAPLQAQMWRTAVLRLPIPRQALAQALGRIRVAIVTDQVSSHAAIGLLRAFHVRKGDSQMHPQLNEDHPHPAYHCGRLMAVLAYLQYRALGDVGAGVVQRYYAAASTTPALVLGRLVRTAQFHLHKLEGGLAHWHEDRLAAVWGRVRDQVPKTLTLEEQSLFALGYYHQIAADRAGVGSSGPATSEAATSTSDA